MSRTKLYQVEVYREATYVINVHATSEDDAEKVAKKIIKTRSVAPEEETIEVIDLREGLKTDEED